MPDLYDLYDLYDPADVAGWEPYNLRGLAHVSWVGSVLFRSYTTTNSERQGKDLDFLQLDRDLPDVWNPPGFA